MDERTSDRKRDGRRAARGVLVLLAALAMLVLTPGLASAAPASTFTDRVSGIEYGFTPTVGRFAGVASGPRPGTFDAVVPHDALDPAGNAAIRSGGSFVIQSSPSVRGSFTGGTIRRTSGGSGCRNETFAVTGDLAVAGGGTGRFQVTLTHYQRPLGTTCLTYFATVAGGVTITQGGGAT